MQIFCPLGRVCKAIAFWASQHQGLQQLQTWLQSFTQGGPDQTPTLSTIKALWSGVSVLDIRADARSRRASSLAPGPETPAAATPLRDVLHSSETGRRLSWRRTAALLQTHARRFSSSSGLDRTSEPHHLVQSPEPESSEAQLHLQQADSSSSAALGYADLLLGPSARPQQLHGLPKRAHKSSDGFDSSKRLTPQSVISVFINRSPTASEAGDQPDQDHRGMSPQQHTLDEYAAQFNLAADQQGLLRPPLEYRDAPRISRAERQVKRLLSSVQPRALSLTSRHCRQTPSQMPQGCSSHGFCRNQAPSSSSPSFAAKRQRFQHIVYSRPSTVSGSECIEGQYTPAPLPSNELARQAALDSLDVMKDPPASALHDIAVCAASAFQVPVVVITLIGDGTIWFQVRMQLLLHYFLRQLRRTHPPARTPTHMHARPCIHSLTYYSLTHIFLPSFIQTCIPLFYTSTSLPCFQPLLDIGHTYVPIHLNQAHQVCIQDDHMNGHSKHFLGSYDCVL